MPSVGGNRWLAMSKYLRRQGHQVFVLTTAAFGSLPDDADQGVFRAEDLLGRKWFRRLLRRPPLPEGPSGAPVDKPPPEILTRIVVPDFRLVTWVPFATRAARRLVTELDIDCVVTTSAYESTHVVGLGLGRRRPAWVADFRDAWSFQPWRPPFPTGLQRRLDVALERRVVTTADRVTVVEGSVGRDFRERLGIDAAYVPNGWDPELDVEAAEPPVEPDGRVLLVHTGKLLGDWGRTPAKLFDALRRLRDEDPELAARLRLVLAGRLDAAEAELIEAAGLDGIVEHVGQLSRADALALQRSADALVLLSSATLAWELPGKVFEYLGAGRPILALAHDNDAARFVEETRLGMIVHPDDVPAITDALRRVARGELAERYAPQGTERFVYPAPAAAMTDEIERAIAAAGR